LDFYFNPYPEPATDTEDGKNAVLRVVDAWTRLALEMADSHLSGVSFNIQSDSPIEFKLVYDNSSGIPYRIGDILYKVRNAEREKIKILLEIFSKGKKVSAEELEKCENWHVLGIGKPASVLEYAKKQNAVAFTIATTHAWAIDRILFEGRNDWIHNLWGQEDISEIQDFCFSEIANPFARFATQFDAEFCEGVKNDFPPANTWDDYRIFENMKKAQDREFDIDGGLIKRSTIDKKMQFTMRELRDKSSGARIFFTYLQDNRPSIIIGGFYIKRMGPSENTIIQQSANRIKKYLRKKYG